MKKSKTKKSFKQMVRFGIVGVFNTLIDYGSFYVFLAIAGLHKSISQVFATAVAMCGSYILNKHWTFGKEGRGNAAEIAKFVVVNIASLLATIFFTHLFYDILHIENTINNCLGRVGVSYIISGDLAIMLCKVCASVFSLIINFLGNKFWVFKAKK